MKKVLVFLLLCLSVTAFGQDPIYYEDTPTLVWDAVTVDSNGDPFLPGDVIEYEVYLWDMADGDPVGLPVSSLIWFGVTANTQMTLSFPSRVEWAVILRTKHTDGGANVTYSGLSYTTVAADTLSGIPFVYIPVLVWTPAPPGALRDSGI